MKKIVLNIILIFNLFFIFLANVNATSFESNMTVSKSTIKQGGDIVITVKTDNYKEISKGFYVYKATLNYDNDVFETVSEDDFILLNDWTGLEYNSNNGQFIVYKKYGSQSGEKILKVSLKVRKDAKEGNTNIYINDVVTSEGYKDLYFNNDSDNLNKKLNTKIEVIKKIDQSDDNEDNSVDDNNDQNNDDDSEDENDTNTDPNNKDDSNNRNDVSNSDDTVDNRKKKKISNNYFWIALIILIVLVIIFIIIKKYGNSKKTLLSVGLISIVCLPMIHSLAIYSKGELLEDGVLNYLDVNLLELHLIDKQKLPNDLLDNADMNSDSVINVTDLALLIQKIEKQLNYEVILKDMSISNTYPSKNEELLLDFYARVTDDELIKKVTINNVEYSAEQLKKEKDQIKYRVKIKSPNSSGIVDYKITKVLLGNQKYVEVDNKVSIDVLKDKPQVVNYQMIETSDDSKVNFTFNIIDNDNSITIASFTLLDGENTITSKDVKKGSNTINSTLETGKNYKVKIVVLYDLDSNSLAEELDTSGKIEIEKSFTFVDNYQFGISEIATYKDGIESTSFEKNDSIVLRFKSENKTEYVPQYITINNKNYDVKKIENQSNYYEAILDDITVDTIKVEKVILSNGKVFNIDDQNEIKINWLSVKPTINDSIEYEENDTTIDFTFTIMDDDNTISKAKIVLYDALDNLISSENINLYEIKIGKIIKKLPTSFSSMYKVEVLVDYSIDGKNTVENSVIYTQDIVAKTKVSIDNVVLDKEYYEKNSSAELELKVTKNAIKDIINIYINSKECKATKISNDTYRVNYVTDNTGGVLPLNITAIGFIDETIDVDVKTEIKILKDAPIISNYKQTDKLSAKTVTLSFNVDDNEESFISAEAYLFDSNGNPKYDALSLQKGENLVTFTVDVQTPYILKIYATYRRDSKDPSEYVVEKEMIYETTVELIENYDLKLENIKAYKVADETNDTLFFNKGENVVLHFNSTNESLYNLYRIFVSGTDYYSEIQVTPTMIDQSNYLYRVLLQPYGTVGKKEININKVTLLNAKQFTLDNKFINIEVIKDKPYVEKFTYKMLSDNKTLSATFTVTDNDNALKEGFKAIIVDNDGNVLKEQLLSVGQNEVQFEKNDCTGFTLKVIGSYDLDSDNNNGLNEETNISLLEAPINVSDKLIEIKDITNVYLYKISDSGLETIEEADVNELNKLNGNYDDYLVKVEMRDLPSFYSKIRSYKLEDKTLKFILDYDNVVQYENDSKRDWIEIEYPSNAAGSSYIVKINSFEQLISQAQKDEFGKTYQLTADLDASSYTSGNAIIDNFKGILNGNNHKIKNLKIPLFDSLTGSISNVTIENARISGSNAYGIVANTSGEIMNLNSSGQVDFTNVHIINSSIKTPNATGTGGFVGKAYNTVFDKCSIRGLTIGSNSYVGGFVGDLYYSEIKSSYITDSILISDNSESGTGGSKAGGLVGVAEAGSYIENCYANVKVTFIKGSTTLGGLIGHPLSVTLKNSLSMVDGESGVGSAYRVYGTFTDGSKISSSSKNNYEISSSNLISNSSNSSINTIDTASLANEEFYTKSLNWSSTIWDFSNIDEVTGPRLKNNDPNYQNRGIGNNEELYIPNYSTFKTLSGFNSNKTILYSNLYKIMPFYETKYLIKEADKVSEDDVLNKKSIKSILPLDKDKKLITVLTNYNYSNIEFVKILFTDNTSKIYNTSFDELKNNVATYELEVGNNTICYNFNKYIINENASVVNELLEYAKTLSYGSGVSANNHRIYKDYYNDVTKNNLKNIILMILQSDDKYVYTAENSILDDFISKELITNKKLNKILYAYNYYDRWYSVSIGNNEIGKINVDELMLLYGDIFENGMSIESLINDIYTSGANLNTTDTQVFYRNVLANYTKKADVGSYFDYLIDMFTEYEDVNDWLKYDYQGIVYEAPAEGHPNVEYRAWALFKKQSKYLLPFITLPANSAYVISCPTQLIMGAQRVYISNPNDATQHAKLVKTVEEFGKKVGKFYSTAAGFVEESTLNNAFTLSIDNHKINGTRQATGTTEEPFHKNFNDAVNLWAQKWGSAAHTIGGVIYWDVDTCLTYYYAWSHETGHDQADKVFFNGIAVRNGAGGEDYPDGNTTQSDGVNFNLTYSYGYDSNIMGNLTPERINSKEKINSYYKEMFETVYFLDYIEAQAFLSLSPEEQAVIATKVSDGDNTTAYRTVTLDQIKEMNLKTITDLYDNKIILRSKSTIGPMQYGSENIFSARRWYQAHNDGGRPDSYSFKYLAWEMLGYAGYNDGYITYYSAKSANDLDAIRKVTKDSTMTWRKYKLGRFESTANNLANMKYLDVEELINLYIKALKEDAANNDPSASRGNAVRRNTYNYLKRVTDDFRTGIYEDEKLVHITTAEEFKSKIMEKPNGNFVLDNDIDLSTLSASGTIITKNFLGKLDGNGHTISGSKLPIFATTTNAQIENLTLDNVTITSTIDKTGALINSASGTRISNIKMNNINITGANEVGGLVGYMSNHSYIKDVEAKDIHVNGNMQMGGIVGKTENYVTIKNISINKNISGTTNSRQIGTLGGSITNTTIDNIHISESQITGLNNVSGFVGFGSSSTINNVSTNTKVIVAPTGEKAGGLFGEISSVTIKNSYAVGEINGNKMVGGLVGIATKSTIDSCYTKLTVSGTSSVGGFIGQSTEKSTIKNNISFTSVNIGYKFDGATEANQFTNYQNNYEFNASRGNLTSVRSGIDLTNKITIIGTDAVKTNEFYINTLNWGTNYWDLTYVSEGFLPKLNSGLDKNKEELPKQELIEINSIDDFKNIKNDLYGTYKIMKDLDFKEEDFRNGSIIAGTFKGTIDGNGATIENFKNASLFETFEGTIKDLKIKRFQNTDYYTEQVNVLTRKSNNATISNIHIDGYLKNGSYFRCINGGSNTALISGIDNGSTIENISITNIIFGTPSKNSTTTGTDAVAKNISLMVGEKTGGSIENSFIDLSYYNLLNGPSIGYYQLKFDLAPNYVSSGGIVGTLKGDAKIKNVVMLNDYKKYDNNGTNNAGFIGNIEDATDDLRIENSIQLGEVYDNFNKADSKATNPVYKFAGFGENLIKKHLKNCYEVKEKNGTSSVTENTKGSLDEVSKSELTVDFYKSMGFDENIWNFDTISTKGYPTLK